MEDLKCPKCGSDSVMTLQKESKCLCRECWHKDYEDQFTVEDPNAWDVYADNIYQR